MCDACTVDGCGVEEMFDAHTLDTLRYGTGRWLVVVGDGSEGVLDGRRVLASWDSLARTQHGF